MSHRLSIALGAAALVVLLAGGRSFAEHSHGGDHSMMGSGHGETMTGHSHEMAMIHGGQVTMTPHNHFEVLFTDAQARVYVYDDEQQPVNDPTEVMATMNLIVKDGKSETMDLHYMPPDADTGRTQGYFYADRHMTGEEASTMKAVIRMTGLAKEPIEFRTPIMMGHLVTFVCPMNDSPPADDPGQCPRCGMERSMMMGGAHEAMMPMDNDDHDHGSGGGEHHH